MIYAKYSNSFIIKFLTIPKICYFYLLRVIKVITRNLTSHSPIFNFHPYNYSYFKMIYYSNYFATIAFNLIDLNYLNEIH